MVRKLTIREAEARDVASIQCVARSSWHAAYLNVLGADTIESLLADWYDTDDLDENVSDPDQEFFVAIREGKVLGFAHARPADKESEIGELARLYVDPDHWDEGAGGTLLARIEYLLGDRGFDRLRLEVLADNAIGISFYESAGFERIDDRETEVDGRCDEEYVYEKSL